MDRAGTVVRSLRGLVVAGSLLAVAGTVHTAVNLRRLRVPDVAAVDDGTAPTVTGRVCVLLPVRDESATVVACLRALLASVGLEDLEVLVLDDGSSDGTAQLVRDVAAGDPRVRLLADVDGQDPAPAEPPPGWLGKTWACARLAAAASGHVLVFADADVLVEPGGIAASVALLHDSGLDLVSPYPRQVALTWSERLVQPLLQWSWLMTLPLRLAESSPRPSLTAANGQLLAVDARAYEACGGHGAPDVRGAVLDDLALARAVKRSGGRAAVVDGTSVASCRMYDGWSSLRAGYGKSLWTAFGSPAGGAAVTALAATAYVLPALAALRGSRVGALGYAAGVAGRVLTARRVGGRVWPDSLAHPVSVALLGGLVVDSVRAHRRGTLTWKGRALP